MATDTGDGPETAGDAGTAGATADEGDRFVPFLGRFFPEALVLAVLLTLLALVVTFPYLDPLSQLEHLATGFFELFELQMALILLWVLSASVVESRPFGRLFDAIAGAVPTTQTGIVLATGFIALVFGWVNWALGLIGGVLIGQRLCRRAADEGERVHYPAVLTAALCSLVITNQGLSSPGGLVMADDEGTTNFLVDSAGSLEMTEFLFAPENIVPSAVLILTLPLLLVALAPGDETDRVPLEDVETIVETRLADHLDYYRPPEGEYTVADRLEQSRAISLTAVAIGAISLAAYFGTGGELTMLWFLFALMMLGLLVQWRPMGFRAKTTHATRWANHLAIPFLLYATVHVLLREAGLYDAVGGAVTALGNAGIGSFVASFVVGLLIPDPGSTWLVLGPGPVAAGADLVRSVVAVMFGAGLSNLWLGFLFVGILSLRGFEYREFVRYAAVITAWVAVVVVASMVVL